MSEENKISSQNCAKHATEFYQLAISGSGKMNSASISILAFACELYLKSFLFWEGKEAKGHNIEDLYKEVGHNMSLKIEKLYSEKVNSLSSESEYPTV